ncbi:DMT family transporter [Methylocucumis oryzae]|uniref:DMT family transporter n=1 Tax=Methylocucumis oryzae TaxID=1632867 RepID=UPI000A89D970|nr:DMT family transporter [Methylocucumis oryzae]
MTQSISHNRQDLFGLTLVLLGALGFSSKAIIIKLAYSASANVDAITLMSLRMVFSLPLFLLVACWHNRNPNVMPLKPKQWLMVSLLGVLGYYLSSYLDFTGLYYISAGLERIILFLYPTFCCTVYRVDLQTRNQADNSTGVNAVLRRHDFNLHRAIIAGLHRYSLWLKPGFIECADFCFFHDGQWCHDT